MKQPKYCACCGRKRGDGRSDRGWIHWHVDAYMNEGGITIGPVAVPVVFCAFCWRTEIKPMFGENLERTVS